MYIFTDRQPSEPQLLIQLSLRISGKATLRCPSKPFKTKETLYDIERTTNNYRANFRLGGCDWPGAWEFSSIKESAVRKPSTVVYKTEAGTQPVNTDDPLRCVTEKYREKPVY